jgi:fumarate hydratase subunit alpha
MCKEAAYYLPSDVYEALKKGRETEQSPVGKDVLSQIIKNAEIAKAEDRPICQDCGMAILFLEIGQDVHFEGGSLEDAINKGVAAGYTEGYLRKSVVAEPIFNRKNTQDNTPAMIYTKIVPGDKVKIQLAPKGFGSENKSGIKMLVPADGVEGVKKAVLDIVQHAGPNPCPPMVIGVGIGGTMDRAALLSKRALVRSINERNAHPEYAKLEGEILELVNKTGIGPQLGGTTTALAVNIEWAATHIAGLPVAVTICCHAMRHKEVIL